MAKSRTAAPVAPWFLYLTVFICGSGVMTIEMAASRLIAPFYGTSLPVWTALIGTLLIFLSLGYWLGGRLADRNPTTGPLYLLIGIAGTGTLLLPWLGTACLRLSTGAIDMHTESYSTAALVLPFLGILLLLAVPITCLGCVGPFAVRLAARSVESLGHTAGRLSAVSNFGSIIGTFLPVFLFIPALGTRNTFLLAGTALVALAVAGGGRRLWLAAAVALVPPTFFVRTAIRPADGLVEEAESAYHHIQVVGNPVCRIDREGGRRLLLNEGHAMHSAYCPGELWFNQIFDWFSIAPYVTGDGSRVDDMLIIGLAAGSVARQYRSLYPGIRIDGVEIDGEVVRAGRDHFELDAALPRDSQYVMDGRTFLHRTSRRYDIILVDAFRQPYIPFHLTTVEFFGLVRDHLKPGGVVVMDVNKVRPDTHDLSARILATMRQVFPHTVTWSSNSYNDLLAGTDHPTSGEGTRERMFASPHEPIRALARRMTETMARNASPRVRHTIGFDAFAPSGEPLTDDRAPVEALWDGMFLALVRPEQPAR